MTLFELVDKNPDGFTFDPITQEIAKHDVGYYIALTDNQVTDDQKFIKAFHYFQTACKVKVYIGGWKEGGKYYVDYVIHEKRIDKARMLREVFKQKAIYDCQNKEVITI